MGQLSDDTDAVDVCLHFEHHLLDIDVNVGTITMLTLQISFRSISICYKTICIYIFD